MFKKITSLCAALAVVASPILHINSAYAEYPEKPVNFVIPFPPGDLEDILTRLIADDFQKEYGVAAAVINKPGGGGGPFPGIIYTANQPADGYTIGSFIIAAPVVGPFIGIPELDPFPFKPIGNFLTYPFVIASSKSAPYDSMESLAEYARNNNVVLGHFGNPLVPTKVTKALAKKMNFSFGSDAAFDALDCNTLASGDADVINTTLQLILPCLDKVNVLASVSGERLSKTPNAPTVGELSADLNVSLWNGLFVHKDVPDAVVAKIVAVAQKTMKSAKAQKIANDTGALVYWQDAASVSKQIEADIETMGRINKALQ